MVASTFTNCQIKDLLDIFPLKGAAIMQLQYYPPNVTKPSSCGSSRQGVAAPDGEQASSDLQGDEMGNTRVEK